MKSEFSPTLEPPSEVDPLPGKPGYANRVCGLCLWAEGMDPNYIDVDGLSLSPSHRSPPPQPTTPSQQIRTSLRIRLTIPSSSHGDATVTSRTDASHPNHSLTQEASRGFNGAVLFPFSLRNAKVLTKVHVANQNISSETSPLQALSEPYASNFTQLSNPREPRDVRSPRLSHHSDSKSSRSSANGASAPTARSAALLPDSWLTRCRWLDTGSKETLVTQQIMIADDAIFVVIYELVRTTNSNITSPRAELVMWHKVYDTHPQQHTRTQSASSVPANGYPSLSSNYSNGMILNTHAQVHHQPHQNAMQMSSGPMSYSMSPTSPTSPVGATHFVNAFAPYPPTPSQQPRSTQQVYTSYGSPTLFNSNSAYPSTSGGISPSQLQLGTNSPNNGSKTGSNSGNSGPGSNSNHSVPDAYAAPFYSDYASNSELLGFSGLNISSLGSMSSLGGGMDSLSGGLNGGLNMGMPGVGMGMNGLNSMLNGGLSGDHWQHQSGSNSGSGSGAGSTPSPGAGSVNNAGSVNANGGQALMSFF